MRSLWPAPKLGAFAFLVVISVSVAAWAQEASVSGAITDATGAVLPGVTVTAQHVDTGNTFIAVTDARGAYRLGLRIGSYRITAELSGFATTVQENVSLLVGQQAVLNFQLSPSSVQETVTVTGEAALIDLTGSRLGGNIDARQLEELPLNGRNWLQLTLLAPGSRVNAVSESPFGANPGQFQLNLDGQQVTSNIAGANFGQPRFARDAIAEFELVPSRFDATQGRSNGVQVNAITKAGTNDFTATLSGFFRDDRFNAKDFIVGRVLPYSNQQISTTAGGPIRRDRIHFFGYYEGEREPNSFTYTSPFPRFNTTLSGARTEHKPGFRMDAQLNTSTRLMVRGNGSAQRIPFNNCGGASSHPSGCGLINRDTATVFASMTRTFGSNAVNELRTGWNYVRSLQESVFFAGQKVPQITLRGYSIGPSGSSNPLILQQKSPSVRNDFSLVKGGHELKIGGEFLHFSFYFYAPRSEYGVIDATGGPIPANIEQLFPSLTDASTWNLAALSPITIRVQQGVGNPEWRSHQHDVAAWVQDNWRVFPKLTLNLGLRYDVYYNAYAEDYVYPPFRPDRVTTDMGNIAPRLGFAYSADNATVIRGGWGKYFAGIRDQWVQHMVQNVQLTIPEALNDGRPDFAANWFNGPAPTFDQVIATRSRRETTTPPTSPDARTPYAWQSSIGMQRQLGGDLAVQADYVWIGERRAEGTRQINLIFDPVTGVNLPFTNVNNRPYPDWGSVVMRFTDYWSDYHGLETAVTKRMSNRWQGSVSYTLSRHKDGRPAPVNTFAGCTYPMTARGVCNVPVKLAEDLGEEYTYASGDQRHRLVMNGIWELPVGFQFSGLYFFGSGQRFSTTYGGDLRNSGNYSARLRPNGTVVPRANLVGDPLHRFDIRLSRRTRVAGSVTIDGMIEVFNLFNHENYGSYTTAESNANYGRPTQNVAVEYQPRMMQLGFRVAF